MKTLLSMAAILFFVSCVGGSAEYKVTRDFIDAYYVMADQQAALAFTSDMAQDKLTREIELLEGVTTRSESYRSRDVEFKKLKEQVSESETHFLYELTLHFPDVATHTRTVGITVDRATHKVKFFGEMNDDAL